MASLHPLAYPRRLEGYSGVGECLGDVRRRPAPGIIPTHVLSLRSLTVCARCSRPHNGHITHWSFWPAVSIVLHNSQVPISRRCSGGSSAAINLAGDVVDDVHVEAGIRERGKACMTGACDERGRQVLVASVLRQSSASMRRGSAIVRGPSRRACQSGRARPSVSASGSGRLDAHGRMPSRMQCRVEAVMQWRDITRQAQERAGETQFARLAQ